VAYWSPVVGRLDDEDGEGVVEHQRSETDVDAIAGDSPENGRYKQVSERTGSSHECLSLMIDGTPGLEGLQESPAPWRCVESSP
jgi:hypothetical protein